MQNHFTTILETPRREPWNKGKLIGAKPPLRTRHVWSIRTKLQIEGRTRDLAMFNLAIDSKLRGCDVVSLKAEDIAPHGHAVERATVRQKKTGQPIKFEMTEQTREAVDDYIRTANKKPGDSSVVGQFEISRRDVGPKGGKGARQNLTAAIARLRTKSDGTTTANGRWPLGATSASGQAHAASAYHHFRADQQGATGPIR